MSVTQTQITVSPPSAPGSASVTKSKGSTEDKNNEKFFEIKEELNKTVYQSEIELVQLYNDRFKDPINFEKKWSKVRDQLKPEDVAIEFSRFNYITHEATDSTYYVAYIIKKDYNQPKVISLFEESTLQKPFSNSSNPKELYNTRGSKARSTSQTSKTSELYQLIWKPIESELDNIANVYFAPTGLLHNVSFSSIKNNDDFVAIGKSFFGANLLTKYLKIACKKYHTHDILPGNFLTHEKLPTLPPLTCLNCDRGLKNQGSQGFGKC